MIKRQFPLLALTAALLFSACSRAEQGSELPKDFEERSFEVSEFDEINLSGYYEISIIKGDEHSLKISAAPAICKCLKDAEVISKRIG